MIPGAVEIWVYLQTTPLTWLAATLVAWVAATQVNRALGGSPLAHPVALAAGLLAAALLATGTPYQRYFEGAQFVHFLLGPATVALAVPLWRQRAVVRAALGPMVLALAAGAMTAMVSTVLVARALGASSETLLSLVPKSVTTPVAMALAEGVGGSPSVAALAVLATGIFGAMIVTPLFDRMGMRDWRARGFAAGVAAHGIGTARAFQVHEVAGSFAGIAMALNALATALVMPMLAWLWR